MKILIIILWMLFSQFVIAENPKSSKEYREANKYEVSLAYGPDYKEITKQLIFGYMLNEDNSLNLKLGYTDNQSSKHWRHVQLNATFQYKKFISNSFYYSPELVYLDYRAIYSEENSSASGDRFNGMGVGVRIGNQWHWDHFTLGCDWFGGGKMSVYLGHKSENEYFFTFLNTYFGYSF